MKNTLGLFAMLAALATVCSGCSNHVVVVGNLASVLVAFGLFYGTVNLRKER